VEANPLLERMRVPFLFLGGSCIRRDHNR
jgi:hypothetical protein